MIFAVLGTGPSMNQALAESLRGRCKVMAVSDSWRLAPWADALVATDHAWWRAHPQALDFKAPKYGGMVSHQNIEGVERMVGENGTNSALLATKVAVMQGATKVLLCGVDMHSPGLHFFGKHSGSLRSTTPHRMEQFKEQFGRYRPKGVQILNCTIGSALRVYPMAKLEDALC